MISNWFTHAFRCKIGIEFDNDTYQQISLNDDLHHNRPSLFEKMKDRNPYIQIAAEHLHNDINRGVDQYKPTLMAKDKLLRTIFFSLLLLQLSVIVVL